MYVIINQESDVLVGMHQEAKQSEDTVAAMHLVIVKLERMPTCKRLHIPTILCKTGREWKSNVAITCSKLLDVRSTKHFTQDRADGNRPVGRCWHQHLMVQLPSTLQQPQLKLR